MVKASHADQVKAVRHAIDLGINFFDTAFAYGLGKSEENLGGILKELGAEPVISTKVRLEADCLGDVRAATIRAVEAGLSRLQRERVDFVQLHTRVTLARGMGQRFSLTPPDVLGLNGVIDGFKTMRDCGKVGHFGFSGLGDPKALHELVDSGEFHGLQAYYNLLNPSAGRPPKLQRTKLRTHHRSGRRKVWVLCDPRSRPARSPPIQAPAAAAVPSRFRRARTILSICNVLRR
jgi:L-glyceraldehyde 3-phosphate reductase